jgi:hypothetical protein
MAGNVPQGLIRQGMMMVMTNPKRNSGWFTELPDLNLSREFCSSADSF